MQNFPFLSLNNYFINIPGVPAFQAQDQQQQQDPHNQLLDI